MGQVHVASVRVESLPEVWAALCRDGFAITIANSPGIVSDTEVVRCRRGDRELALNIDHHGRDAAEVLVIVAHPPYTVWPWRWSGDARFFGDLTAILDEFHYRM